MGEEGQANFVLNPFKSRRAREDEVVSTHSITKWNFIFIRASIAYLAAESICIVLLCIAWPAKSGQKRLPL